jgi:glycosyltransferase involved in cell wall biosynthesis
VIVGPWWRPLPPVRDGAPEWVIEHTVRRLPTLRPVLLSPWHADLDGAEFDRSRYLHVRAGMLGRIAPRLPYRLARSLWGTSDPAAIPYVAGLRARLRQLRPDIVVTHVLPGLAVEARRACPSARVIHYSHTHDLHEAPRPEWERLAGALDGLITVCQTSLDALEEKHGPLPFPARAIRNGVDLAALHPGNRALWRAAVREELGLGKGPVLVFCGRLHPRKGADHLLRAFRTVRTSVPDAQLLVVGASTHMAKGADPYTQELAALADACGPDAVRFSGYVPALQLPRVLSAADVGVLPSVEPEGMPLSILEFAACGMPVVASDVGGVAEVIRDGVDGFLIDPRRVGAELTAPLTRLMQDPELRARCGRSARARAEAQFGWSRVSAEFERVLSEFTEEWAEKLHVRDHRRLYASSGSSEAS